MIYGCLKTEGQLHRLSMIDRGKEAIHIIYMVDVKANILDQVTVKIRFIKISDAL